jgi:hypothetical protein
LTDDTFGTPVEDNTAALPTTSPQQLQIETLLLDSLGLGAVSEGSGGIEGAYAFALKTPANDETLWLAHTIGIRNFDPIQHHTVAIFKQSGDGWAEVTRFEFLDPVLDEAQQPPAQSTPAETTAQAETTTAASNELPLAPDYLGVGSIRQVEIDPVRLWFEVSGGVGAHSGTYHVLRLDGDTLKVEAAGFSAAPGGGRTVDINHDGVLEVVLDASDYYVFCYACGVRWIQNSVLHWNGSAMEPVELQMLGNDAPEELKMLNNTAVNEARVGLWKDAFNAISEVEAKKLKDESGIFAWNAALIRLTSEERRVEAESNEAYPLLSRTFYGDFAASVDAMRGYSAESIFSMQSPLLIGTVAEGNESALAEWLTHGVNGAIELYPSSPESAPAYFLRSWAAFLKGDLKAALTDAKQAVDLAPDDTLYQEGAAFLKKAQ